MRNGKGESTKPPVEGAEGEMQREKEAGSRIVVLFSHERSGSHYLAEMLASGGQLVPLDELCNFDAVDPEKSQVSFFGFQRRWQEAHPDLAMRPDSAAMGRFVDDWLDHILKLNPEGKVLIDIKYGHVHNFEPGWWPSEHRPYLIKYLDRRRIAVIHLARRNSVEAIVSAIAAEAEGVWHRRGDWSRSDRPKLRVPAADVVQRALLLQREKENFRSWLAGTRCFDLAYEDIREDGAVKTEVLSRACEHLGIRPSRFRSKLERTTPPLRDLVENYGELRRTAVMFGLPGLKPRG